MKTVIPIGLFLAGLCLAARTSAEEASNPEPGPENAGMRLRFLVVPERKGTNEIYRVRMDLINVTDKPIKLIADWDGGGDGTFQEYLNASLSIATDPPIRPYVGQIYSPTRKSPEPAYTLGAHETVTVQWTNSDRRLKKSSINLFIQHNPTFPTDGLYSVHASLSLRVVGIAGAKELTAEDWRNAVARAREKRRVASFRGAFDEDDFAVAIPPSNVLLRSNEQLVSMGGSHAMPKHALAKLISADTNQLTATIDLGSMHKIEVGDHFQILTGAIGSMWHLNITNVDRLISQGMLEPPVKRYSGYLGVLMPGTLAELIPANDPRHW